MMYKLHATPWACRQNRQAHGQALTEGAAMLVVMVPIVALLILFLLNTYFVTTYNLKVQAIAFRAARQLSADKWWLGMQRTDYSKAAEDNARETINAELGLLGLRCKSPAVFAYRSGVMLRKKDTTIVRVDFDVDGLKAVKGFFFTPGMTLHASGISSDAEHAVTRHGQVLLQAVDPVSGQGIGIRIPAYNATVGNSKFAHPTWLRAGRSAGTYPVAYLRVKAKMEGCLINKKQDFATPDGNVVTQDVLQPAMARQTLMNARHTRQRLED
jgi:hypothetical protein